MEVGAEKCSFNSYNLQIRRTVTATSHLAKGEEREGVGIHFVSLFEFSK